MAEQEYFKNALSDFTYEAASGGAIRHLTDLGYTVKQICEQLSFPTPYARVQKTVWQRLLDTGVLLTEEPGSSKAQKQGKAEYAMERDKYGRTSFRMVVEKDSREDNGAICWKERRFGESGEAVVYQKRRRFGKQVFADGRMRTGLDAENCRKLAVYLAEKCRENGGDAYISCRFGRLYSKERTEFEAVLTALNERQQEYVTGLPWEDKVCYHRLDQRMQEIAVRLYDAGKLRETCYFMKTEERVELYR